MYQEFQGNNGLWGVQEEGHVVYDATFERKTAYVIADMYNSENPPADWHETSERLKLIGLLG